MFAPSRLFSRRLVLALVLAVAPWTGCRQGTDSPKPDEPAADGMPNASVNQRRSRRTEEQKYPRVKIETLLGDMVLKLDGEKAPLTVNNFLQYADEGFYDGTIFHDVSDGYAIIGGGYAEDLTRKPTHLSVRNEAHNGLKNLRGTIAMAREPGTIDSATSLFFLNLADNPHMDHRNETTDGYGYCVFGRVVEGMDVADRIGKAQARQATAKDDASLDRLPVEAVVIKSIRVLPASE
ncbi:MAG TPA: peptidylprolyl isomerase [Thermoguttaceae bacterium]|nr:peptidylprolyl isomerase [Thermoguttaceae bacterium]